MKKVMLLFFSFTLYFASIGQVKNENYSEDDFILSDNMFVQNSRILFKESQKLDFGEIKEILDFDDRNNELILESRRYSTLDSNKVYTRYKQFFKGKKVSGGGLIVTSLTSGPRGNPCSEKVIGLHSNIIKNFADYEIRSSKEIMFQNALKLKGAECEIVYLQGDFSSELYIPVWKIRYISSIPVEYYINAFSGEIITISDMKMKLCAETVNFGQVELDEYEDDNGVHYLQSPESDDVNIVISFNDNCNGDWSDKNLDTSPSNIPQSTNIDCWGDEASACTYQAFYVTNIIIPQMNTMLIDLFGYDTGFQNVIIGTCDDLNSKNSAFNWINSTLENTYLNIPNNSNGCYAQFDIIAHELAHVFLWNYVDYSENSGSWDNRSVHEGVADIIGIYIESLNTGSPDWLMGQNLENSDQIRDLTTEPCADSWYAGTDAHERGKVLSNWFRLFSQEFGMDYSLKLLSDGLNDINSNDGPFELMESIMSKIMDDKGECTPEFQKMVRTMNLLCVPNDLESCDFGITYDNVICEEDDSFVISIFGGKSGQKYRFVITGQKSTEYEGNGQNPSSNSFESDRILKITDIPKYSYYPQYITIDIYPIGLDNSSRFSKTINIKIVDCNGDDPDCEDFHENKKENNNSMFFKTLVNSNLNSSNCISYDYFSILGRKLSTNNLANYKGLYFKITKDCEGVVLHVDKIFLYE